MSIHVTLPSTSFRCNTCEIQFVAADLQREHMKTRWHSYNLKRRIADLPRVTSDIFAHKVLYQERLASTQKEVDEFGFEIRKPKKKINGARGRLAILQRDDDLKRDHSPAKSIVSELSQFSLGIDTFGDGINDVSDTHSEYDSLEFVSDANTSDVDIYLDSDNVIDASDVDSSSDEEGAQVLPITYCFYCQTNNRDIESNLKHMFDRHGLYIPERNAVSDLQGLLVFLSEMIYIDNECYVCGFIGRNLQSVCHHMTSKGHCKIPYETEIERDVLQEFYQGDGEVALKSKLVRFDSIASTTRSRSFDNNTKRLITGLEVGHRRDQKYFHKPAASILNTTTSVVQTPTSLMASSLSKQQKRLQMAETRKNTHWRNSRLKRQNFQRNYRDELLQ